MSNAYLNWQNVNFTWDEWETFWEVANALPGYGADPVEIDKLPNEKKKKLVRLIMHMKDIKVYDEKKEIKKLRHKIEDIKIIAEELKRYVQIIH
jgi:hypothetical protein